MRAGIFLAFLGRGPLGWEFYWCLATNWEKSQMNMFLIFYKGCLKLHVVINYFISFDFKVKERTSR